MIRDYALVDLIGERPIVSMLMLVLFMVDPKVVLVLSSGILSITINIGLFNTSIFSLKYCSYSMVKLVKCVIVSSIVKCLL